MKKKLKIKLENNLTFEQGFKEFIDYCKARNLRPYTLKHYREGYAAITKFVDENILIHDINQGTVDKFVIDCNSNLKLSSQSLYTYTRDFKTILYYFMRMEYMKIFKIQLPKVDKVPIETYSDKELEILLKRPDLKTVSFAIYRDYVLINFLLSTGVRLNSFINIKIKDLDFENEVVYVNVTKNRKPLIVPLNPSIIKVLKEYLKIRQYRSNDEYLFCTAYNKQLTKNTIAQSLRKYNKDRGLEKCGIHRYRHTFAKKFIIAGGSPAVLQKILGHSSLLITQNYLNILVSDIKKEMNEFDILKEFGYIIVKRRGSISNITTIVAKQMRNAGKKVVETVKKVREKINSKKGNAYSSAKKESKFNNFEQRNYNFSSFEDMLLGNKEYDSDQLLE